jgi:hypothetical protein
VKRALDVLSNTLAGAVLALELAALVAVSYRYLRPDAPELEELLERAWSSAREQARYRNAIRETFESIRRLPETEEPSAEA